MVAKKPAVKGTEQAGTAAPEQQAGTPGRTAAAGSAAAAGKTLGKKTLGKKAAKKAATGKQAGTAAPAKKSAEKTPAEKTGAKTVVAKKTPAAAASPVPKARAAAEPGELAVRPGEDPWSAEEVDEARTVLHSEAERLRNEITASEAAITGLMRDSGDGAGDDQADTGTKNITREHEMALNANAREMLEQTERVLERLDAGTYGLCESCGNPIGKARMQAFPRATLCVECKQRQERR
ncbi:MULTISPECIES: TraR/DksA C4-type zinc finger protein [Streptomyces]|uniref:DNA-binding protein n=1 Tax=Streptomyces lycii TaxID=2654337 RepID=A0ABQ7FHS9_9ACTN|nr:MULTISPECIES: TraR/DksA C4-type zinc finger protein [Streptomyces]KAF4407376.1 DNA-binding protein [Streptomyces lycii]PGH50837.1 DNA-binding protein [Streptomyces sp. Ru87]